MSHADPALSHVVRDFVRAVARRAASAEVPEEVLELYSAEATQSLFDRLGLAPPRELLELEDHCRKCFIYTVRPTLRELVNPAAAEDERRVCLEIQRDSPIKSSFNDKWVPVFSHGDGSYDFLDYTRWDSASQTCPVICRSPFDPGGEVDIAPTFAALLRMLTMELEANDPYYDKLDRDDEEFRRRMTIRGTRSLEPF